ncbi:MAG TPA: AtpZ/AtpI family protein [Candidatus Binatia bacterium]|nr:AtpZ/AtpI family protein [Candidatus Binatia bacterium]
MTGDAPPPDDRDAAERRRREVAIQMTALGLEFSGSVIGGLALGYYLDRWLGTGPWLLVVLTFGGMATAFARIIALTRRFDRLRREREGGPSPS